VTDLHVEWTKWNWRKEWRELALVFVAPAVLVGAFITTAFFFSDGDGENPYVTVKSHWVASPSETLPEVLCRWQGQMGSKAQRLMLTDAVLNVHPTKPIDVTGLFGDASVALHDAMPDALTKASTFVAFRYDGTIAIMGGFQGQPPQEVLFRQCPPQAK